jgi:hypothetical protein
VRQILRRQRRKSSTTKRIQVTVSHCLDAVAERTDSDDIYRRSRYIVQHTSRSIDRFDIFHFLTIAVLVFHSVSLVRVMVLVFTYSVPRRIRCNSRYEGDSKAEGRPAKCKTRKALLGLCTMLHTTRYRENQSINQPKIERSKRAPTPHKCSRLPSYKKTLNVKQGDFEPPPNTDEEGFNAVALTFEFEFLKHPQAFSACSRSNQETSISCQIIT